MTQLNTGVVETQEGTGERPQASLVEPTDLVVLMALEEEFTQFCDLVPDLKPARDDEYGGYDYLFQAGPASAPYRVVARLVGNMGPERAGLFTDRMLARWRPVAVVMVGIAGGLHDDVKVGDVVVAEQVNAYLAETKATPKGKQGFALQPRPRVFQCDHAMLQEVANLAFVHREVHEAWRSAGADDLVEQIAAPARTSLIQRDLVRAKPALSRIHLASGPAVVTALEFATWLRAQDANIKAAEMEAAGLVESAATRREPVRTLVIRGISDLGDERKKELDQIGKGGLRRLAMRNATRLLLAMLDAGVIPRHTPLVGGRNNA